MRPGRRPAGAARAGAQRRPAGPDARLVATLGRGRARRTIGFGDAARMRVRLTDAGGRPIAGAALQVLTREARAGSDWRLAPAPPRAPTAARWCGSRRARRAASGSRTARWWAPPTPSRWPARALDVRAGVTLRISPRRARAGRTIRLRGRLKAPPATRLGKLITLQARERGRWRDFATARSRRGGRFAARYRFSGGARGVFPIRAVARADAAYPYATGQSRAVRVRVG